MATSVATTLHGWADNGTFPSSALRLGVTSHAGVVTDGSSSVPMVSRSGILPGPSSPLNVTQLGTPTRQVSVKKGTVIQQSTSSTGGVYSHTLTADTTLDIDTADGSQPRLDVVVATIFDNGLAPSSKIEILKGDPAASPSLPTALTSPPAYTHYFPLAQVRVNAAASTIVNANITKPAVSGMGLTMGQYTCAPGGSIRGTNREWWQTRTATNDPIVAGATGALINLTVPAADVVPGVYLVNAWGSIYQGGSPDAGTAAIEFQLVSPSASVVVQREIRYGRADHVFMSIGYVHLGYGGSSLIGQLNAKPVAGGPGCTAVGIGYPCKMQIVRVSDL